MGFTFYAYPTVVKAAMSVFRDVVVVGYDEGNAIAAASMVEVDDQRMEAAKSFVSDLTNEEPVGDRFIFRNTHIGFMYERDQLSAILAGMDSSSDDNLATEYILNRRVELFPGMFRGSMPIDIRVWPRNADDLAVLRDKDFDVGLHVTSGGPDEERFETKPLELRRSGGSEDDSEAFIRDDGSIAFRVETASDFEWPRLNKAVGAQWIVATDIRKPEAAAEVNVVMKGKIRGRGLAGLKVFCGQKFIAQAYTYAGDFELPLVALSGSHCADVNLHVTLDTLPGRGTSAELDVNSIAVSIQ